MDLAVAAIIYTLQHQAFASKPLPVYLPVICIIRGDLYSITIWDYCNGKNYTDHRAEY